MQAILSSLNKKVLTGILFTLFLFTSCQAKLTDELVFKIVLPEDKLGINYEKEIEQTLSILTARLDKYGLFYGEDQLKQVDQNSHIYSIMLPEIKDKELLERLITNTGNLGFWEVYPNRELDILYQQIFENEFLRQKFIASHPGDNAPSMGHVQTKDTALVMSLIDSISRNTYLSDQVNFAWSAKSIDDKNRLFALYALKITNSGKDPAMDGESIIKADAQSSEYGPSVWFVNLEMDATGTKQWADLTSSNIGRTIAITIDNKVYSAPNVHTKIEGGKTVVSGNFDETEAKEMAMILGSGYLPLKVEIMEFISKKGARK